MQHLFSTGGSRAANGDDFALGASCWSNPHEGTHPPSALTRRVVAFVYHTETLRD
jgi:hypothetical protein